MKAQWGALERIQVDTKDLDDIPEYWPQMRRLGLPGYQFTARDVRTGAQFLGFAYEKTLTHGLLFISLLICGNGGWTFGECGFRRTMGLSLER